MRLFWGCLFIFFSLTACSAHEDEQVVNANMKNGSFSVVLPANPTTGFQWSVVQYDTNLLTLDSSNFEKPHTNLIGAGGQMHYTFKLIPGKKYPGSTIIQFKYSRAWEPQSAVMKTVKVNLK